MEIQKRQPIGVELVKRGIVKEIDIQRALDFQKTSPQKKIGDILYEMGVSDPRTLIEAIGNIIGIKGMIIDTKTLNLRLVDYIGVENAKKLKVLPIEIVNGTKMKICFSNTTDRKGIEQIRMLLLKGL